MEQSKQLNKDAAHAIRYMTNQLIRIVDITGTFVVTINKNSVIEYDCYFTGMYRFSVGDFKIELTKSEKKKLLNVVTFYNYNSIWRDILA